MAALTASPDFCVDNSILSKIPMLKGPINYNVWQVHLQSTLKLLSIWDIVDGTVLYSTTAVADQPKWITIDKHICGIISNTINDALAHNISFTYVPSTIQGGETHPSVAKVLYNRLVSLYGN